MSWAIAYEALDEIPTHWQLVGVPHALSAKSFRVGKVKRAEYMKQGSYPIVDQGQELIAGYWNDPRDVYDGSLPVVVFGDHTRLFKFVDFRFVCGADGTKVLVPDQSRFDPEFLYFALLTVSLPSRGYNRHFKLLREKVLPQPPLVEQRAIAHVLSTVQRAREQTERMIAAARELKRSLMRDLFTCGAVSTRDLSARPPLVETSLGPRPPHWSIVALNDVKADSKYAIAAGPFGSKLGQKDYVANGVPVLRGTNLVGGRNVVLDNVVYVSEAKADELSSSLARPGDVVVTQRGSLGLAALIPRESLHKRYVVSQSQMKFTANPSKVLPGFVLHALQTNDSQQRIEELAIRSGVPHINLSIFRTFEIPLPPLAEQQFIVDCLDAVDDKIEAELQHRDALNVLFKSLLDALMTARLRVGHLATKFA